MKHSMKRALSLVLAVIMTLGLLPTSTFAARWDEETPETPVTDDRVVDTQRKEDEEQPEVPEGPDDPVKPTWALNGIDIEFHADGSWTAKVHTNAAPGTNAGDWGFLLVPLYGKDGYVQPGEENVTGANTTNFAALKNHFTQATVGLTEDIIFGKGGGAGSMTTDSNGDFVIDSDSPLPSSNDLKTSIDGIVGVGRGPSDVINFRVLFLAKSAESHVTETTTTYGGGLADSVWVVNLSDAANPTIQKKEGDTLSDDEGGLANVEPGATPRVTIPLYNTSGTEYTIPFDNTTNIPGATEYVSGSGNYTMVSKTETTTSSLSTGTMQFDLDDQEPQNLEFKVPYYTAEGNKVDTITVKVMVIKAEMVAEEVVFRVSAKDLGASSTASPISIPITLDLSVMMYTGLFTHTDEPAEATPQDSDLGLSFEPDATSTFTPDPNGSIAADMYIESDITMIYGTLTDTVDGTGTDHTGTASVVLTPSTFGKSETEYSAGYTYRTMIHVAGGVFESEYGGYSSFDIPVKVIVEPSVVEKTYDIAFANSTTAPGTSDMSTGLPLAISGKKAGETVTWADDPAATGWVFKGWSKTNGGTVAIAKDAKSYTVSASDADDSNTITLYAVWDQLKYDINYVSAHGTKPDNDTDIPYGTTGKKVAAMGGLDANGNVTESGHIWHFDGWQDESGTAVNVGDAIEATGITKDHTYTAQWTEMFTVTYKYYDGTTADTSELVASGGKGTLPNYPTWAGHSANGWYTTQAGGTKVGDGGADTPAITANVTYHLQWSQIMHHVTYDWGTVDNGSGAAMVPYGVGKPTQADVAEGRTFDVSTALDTSTVYTNGSAAGLGYNFVKWVATGGATGDKAPGDTVTMGTSDITLTAQWEPKNYTVSYVKGTTGSPAAATIADNSKQVQHGATHTVGTDGGTAVTGVTSGWQFGSWDKTGTLTITADTTITAQWQVKVSYALDGGTLTDYPADHWVDYNTVDGDFPADPPTKAGWNFLNWKDGGGNVVTAASKFTEPTTVTAQWSKKTTSVTFHWNNGTAQSTKVDGEALTAVTSGIPTPSRIGYHWDSKWYTDTTYATEATLTFPADGNLDVYAQLLPDAHTITYDPGAATGATIAAADKTQAVVYDQTDATAAASSIISGYTAGRWTFLHWKVDGSNKTYAAGATLDRITGDVKLVAQWQETGKIKFNPGTGANWVAGTAATVYQKSGNVGATTSAPASSTMAKTGYHFDHWENGAGDAVNTFTFATDTYGANASDWTKATEYTAVWEPDEKTVTFNRNYTSTDSTTVATWTRDYDGTVLGTETKLPEPTRTYYTLDGWYTERTGGTEIDGTETVTGDVTYYAHWTQKTSNVVINFRKTMFGGSASAYSVTGKVKLQNGSTVYDAAVTSDNTVTINGVPQGTTSYDLYFSKDGTTWVDTTLNVVVKDGTDGADQTPAENVDFYEVKAQTDGFGHAIVTADTGTLVMEGTSPADTSSATNDASLVILMGGGAKWSYTEIPGNNRHFDHWDTSTKTNPSVTNIGAPESHKAVFLETAYTGTLVLTQDGVDVTGTGTTAIGSGKDIVSITLKKKSGSVTDTATYTPTYTAGKWTVNDLPKENTYTWTVTTRTGSYTVDVKQADPDATMKVFKVSVTGNAPGGPNPTIEGGTDPIVVPAGTYDLGADTQAGYTHTGWVQSDGTALPSGLDAATDKTKLTIGTGYAGTTGGITIKPTFTFETTIETRHKTDTGTLTNVNANGVVLYPTGTTTGGKTGVKQTADGTYKVTGLDPDTTYDIWINGFQVGLGNEQVTSANANGKVPVIVFKVTVTDSDSGNGTTGRAVGLNSASGTEAIVPNGAAVTTDAPTVKVTAAAKTPNYRERTTAVDGTGKTYWTADAGTVVAADVDKDTAGWTITSMTADVELTANVVRQYKVTAVKSPGTAVSTVTPTVQTGIGSAVSGENAVRIDGTNGVAKITVTKDDDEEIVSWGITGGDGKLYTDAECTTELKAADYKTTTVAYAHSSADATVTVTFGERHYNITVHTLKNKGVNYPNVKVKLGSGGTEQTTDANGLATFSVTKGEYEAYANGTSADLTTGTLVATGEKATVNATTNAGGATITIQYYDVNLVTNDLSATPNAAGGGKVLFGTGTPTDATDSIILQAKPDATNQTDVKATANDATNAHYRIASWSADVGSVPSGTASSGKYTLPAKTDTALAAHEGAITVTVNFMKQYKVTVAKDAVSVPPTIGVQVKKTGDANYVAGDYVLVDAGSSADAHMNVNGTMPAEKYFKDWTVDSGSGTFNTARTDKGYEKTADNVFYPEADSTIKLYLWTDAGINPASATYDKGSGTNTWDNKVKFTIQDAKDVTETFAFTDVSGSAVTPVLNTDYTKTTAGGVTTYTFDTDFLKTLKTTTHTLTINYKLDDVDGDTGSHTNKVPDMSKTFTLTVDVTAYKLTETKIQVKDGSKTLNVDKTDDRGTAEYKSHENKNIDPLDQLTLQWFYAATDPQERALTAEEIAGLAAATPTYPAGWHRLMGTEGFTGTGTTYTNIPHYPGRTNILIKGQYVFAVAKAESTGTGSVITNAIPVDYDGHITVKKDDKTVEAATGYTVRLWPTDGGPFAAATAIQTTYNATNKTFDTADSALTGGKSYHVYVTTVEGGTAYQKVDGITITGTGNTATVNYYGVRAVTTDLLHAGASHELGEDFTTKTAPDTQFAVKGGAANGETVTSGKGVVSGTTVTATPSKAWASDHDYKWNWSVQAQDNKGDGTNADPTLTYGTEGQASGAATKDYTVTETNWIGGQMEQRTYTVTGDLKSLSGTGKLDTATLTSGAHSFTGSIGNSKTAPATVTFTGVPRNVAGGAVGEHYTISATPGNATTIIGYKAPAATAADWAADPVSNADKVTVSPAAYQNRFTIFVEATNKVLTVVDAHKDDPAYDAGSGTHDDDKAEASGTGNDAMTHTDTGVFRNYTWSEKTVTITNNGNTELEVTLKITNGAGDVYTGTQDTDGTLVDGEVTITDLDQLTGGKVKLAPGESKTFGLTTKGGLDAYDDDTYSFVFSSKDARVGHTTEDGPTVTYNYKMVVNPVEITKVTAVKQATGEYKVTDFTIKEANGKGDLTVGPKTANDAADPTSGDLIYTWYVAAWNDAVTLDKNTGEPKLGGVVLPVGQGTISDNGKTYTPTAADKGKALYLVVKGRPGSNAKSAAMTPNPEENDPVVLVPYQGVVQIHEDDVLMDNDTRAGDYVVELRREGMAAIPMQWDGDKDAFVTNGDVLWARDPDWAADSGTEPTAWEYEVWASRVPGDDKATLQNTGLVIKVDNKDQDHIVDYYKVLIGETNVTQGIYEGKLADLTAGGIFLTKATLAQAKPKAETTVDTLPVADGGYVQKGNDVTFTYDNWAKDYKMTWSGAISDATNNGPADMSVHRAYSAKETKVVNTTLSLKTYPVRVTVTGTVGKVDVITMTLGGNTFTTATTGGIVGIGTGLSEVAIGSNPTFQLPKADGYTTTATVTDTAVKSWSYTYGGAQTDGTNPSITVNVKGIAAQDTYNINLLGDGYAMSVTDNVPTNVDDITDATSVTATSSIPDGVDATVQNNGATQTIHLNYNYARLDDPDTEKPQKVILTLKNEGNDDTRTITNVSVNEIDKQNITAATLGTDTLAPGASTTLELTIAPGLAVGDTIHYKAEFNFTGGGKDAKVTYELTVVVDPLPFTAVSTKPGTTEGTHTVNEYTVQPAPEGANAVKDTTISPAGADKRTGLTYDTDYVYKWVRTAMDVDLTNADVTWNNGTVTLPGTATDCTGTGHDKPTYTPDDADEGQKLYLVVYAKSGTVNATGAAISPAITTDYTGTIQIKEDATDPVTGTTDPGYHVWFIPAGGTDADKVKATWNGKTDNTAGYSATLDPNVASYTVKVSRANGWGGETEAAHMVTLAGVTITNDHRTDKATYYTVSSKPFVPKEYQTGTGETFQNADKAVTMTLEGKELTTDTPVLANQTVKAKSTNGWDQDYKLFWQTDKVGTNVSITTDTVDTTKQQDRDTAKGENAFSKQITDTTWIGGRLDQNTYEVTGHIRNKTGKTGGEVSKVEMVGGSGNRTYTTDTTNASAISANNSISVGSDGLQGNNGDTVKITVVKGEYKITAYEGTETVITEVTIGADGVVTTEKNPNNPVTWGNRNTADMAGDEKVAQAGRVFNIYLEGQALSLSVEDGHTDHEATSTTLDNNNQAKHTQVYYFNGVDTTAIPLTLTNGSNRQMTVTGAVTKVTSLTGVDFDAGTGLGSALGAGDKVTVTGVPTTGEVIAAGGTASGGSLSVAADAANTDDGIYIFQFTSSGTDTSGATVTGPTVYYVFDLTVEPLPIVEVDAAQDATTKVMSLVDAAGAAGGLDHVRVSYEDAAGATQTGTASSKGLTDNDVIFIWFYADSDDLTADSFTLSGGTVQPKAGVTATKKADGKTCTPTAAEEGKFFYLIAYQKDTDCNASDFAVSDAIYAQVTVSVKAYQTNTTTQVPVTDDFNVVGTLGEGDDAIVKKAQDGQFAVNGNDPKKISFVATQADNADPAKAAWYFTGWGDTAANFTSTTDLTTEYTVTKQDTVIGYYDKLPVLEKDKGYSLVESDEELNRTFTYHPYNGSKHVVVAIAPKAGSSFKSDPTAELMWLDADTWEKVASNVGGTIGEDGNYVLKSDWITTNLQLTGLVAGEYTITFYDLDKGEYKVEGGKPVLKGDGTGYAGYDRTITFKVTGGEVEVDARVKNDAPEGSTAEYHGTVTMTNGAGASNGPGTTARLRTSGGSVTITATPADGYEFAGWELITGTGKITETATGVADFEPYEMGCVVEASFKAGTVTAEDIKATVIYGNNDFEAGSTTQVTGASTATGADFEYTLVDPTALPEWLELNDTTGQFSVKAGSKVNTNVESSTTDSYTAVTDEIVLEVKVTDKKSGANTTVTFTIDVEPGELTINDAAFTVPDDALGGQSVDLTQFTYASVTDQASTAVIGADNGDHTEKGKWSVNPKNYVGNDRENAAETSEYTFTFTYGPAADTEGAEKWNYKPTEVELEFHVNKPPQTIYIADQIKNGGMVVAGTTYEDPADGTTMTGKNGDVPVDLKYDPTTKRLGESITYLDTEPTYTVKIKGEGNLYGMSLTRAELTGFTYVDANGAPTAAPTVEPTWADGDTLDFDLVLTAVSGKVWVGDHTAVFEVTGYSEPDEANWTDATKITATYELSIKVEPKVIDKLVVTVDPPVDGEKPDTDPDIKHPDFAEPDLEKPDRNGNKPIPTVTVTWEDEDGNPVDPDTPFTEGNYKVTVSVTPDPNYVTPDDITEPEKTTLNDKGKDDPTTDVTKTDTTVTITQELQVPGPIGVTFGGFKQTDIGKTVEEYAPASKNEEKYPLASPDYNTGWYWATKDDPDTPLPGDTKLEGGKTYVLTVKLDPNEAYAFIPFVEGNTDLATFNNVALTDVASLAGLDAGVLDVDADGNYTLRYHFTVPSNNPPPPPPECPYQVFYWLGLNGTTDDSTIEAVSEGGKPAHVPEVTAIEGYKFLGWSLTRPEEGKEVTLIDPTAERVTEDTTFYAVYEKIGPVTARHKNYIKGFPDGTFGPEKDITRAQVATIIARAILPGFKEGADYGNIGGYTDVTGHWAASAIAYCSKYGVFKGYDDGTFQPNRSISRQELALVVARLDGVTPAGEIPFTDADQVSAWARDGVYTAYTKGLIRGYDDKTFRPLDNISREEAVTIFNRYLKRGVNAEGLADLTPYLKGEAKGEEGKSYMVWPDVPEKRWSYYDVIEASNDHEFYYVDETNETPPEHWTGCWIDGNWDDGSVDSINPAAGAAETPKTSVPTQGTEALGILAAEPNTWAGPILPPLWVSKEMEVQF